jgi:hypothetical protein
MIASGKYCVTGAVSIANTAAPIHDAALALRQAGHSDSDSIAVTCGDVSILPASVAAILRERKPPRSFFQGEF